MTTTNFTTSLGIALPTTGDLSGTWGDTVNDYISKYLDSAVAGALTVSTDVTLLKTTNAALGATSSQYAILIASGHVANITVTAPAISKVYLVINKSGSYTVKIRGAGPTTGITVPVSTAALVAWDGSDFVLISSTDVNSLSNVLLATKGGTGQSSYAVGDLLYASTTTALSKLADVATGNALISGGVGVAPSYGKIGLTTHVDGTLGVANGGTGAASLTLNNVLLGNGTSAVQFVAPGTTGNVLTSNGTTWQSQTAFSVSTANTFTATQTFNGTSATKAVQLLNAAETANLLGAAPSSTQNFYVNSGAVQFANANTANNWTLNVAFSSGTSLNTAMSVGDSVTIAFLAQNSTTAYYQTAFNIDGTAATVKWLGNAAPTNGNANSIDVYTYSIIKTASATYTVLGSQSRYA